MAAPLQRRALVLLLLLLSAACAPDGSGDGSALDPVEAGRALFTSETFDGNGRVCATCHVLEGFGTLTPELVQAKWEEDPSDPIFRSIDSDDGVGDSYMRLREHATIRVPITLGVHEETGLSVRRCDAPADTMVVLNRGIPSVFNVALERHLMLDGRDGGDLAFQANNAANTHAQPGRQPTAEELALIMAFERSLFSNEAVRRFLDAADTLRLPEGRTESEIRGRAFFEPDRQCGVCHFGPMLNETSPNHPDGPGELFESASVGQNPDNPNPKYEWCWVDPATNQIVEGPDGETRATPVPTSDPGRGLLAGTFPAIEEDGTIVQEPNFGPMTGIGSWFKTPTLWGTPQTAPYFHDNSAKDLMAVMDHYNFLFSKFGEGVFDIPCEFQDPECLSQQDKEDIIAFMQLLSFDEGVGTPPSRVAGVPPR